LIRFVTVFVAKLAVKHTDNKSTKWSLSIIVQICDNNARPRPLVALASHALSWQFELLPPTSAIRQPSRADGTAQLIAFKSIILFVSPRWHRPSQLFETR